MKNVVVNNLARGGLTMLTTALLVACVAQREASQRVNIADNTGNLPVAITDKPAPDTSVAQSPSKRVETDLARRADDRRQEKAAVSLEEVVVTGSLVKQQSAGPRSNNLRPSGPSLSFARSAPSVSLPVYQGPTDTEQYAHQDDNPIHIAKDNPVSTFSIDVDTGAYANVRRFLNAGQLPPQDAVRVEEMINYFDYQYAPPVNRATPFRVSTELGVSPWNPNAMLLKVGHQRL